MGHGHGFPMILCNPTTFHDHDHHFSVQIIYFFIYLWVMVMASIAMLNNHKASQLELLSHVA